MKQRGLSKHCRRKACIVALDMLNQSRIQIDKLECEIVELKKRKVEDIDARKVRDHGYVRCKKDGNLWMTRCFSTCGCQIIGA